MASITLGTTSLCWSRDKSRNFDKILEMIVEAGEEGVDVLVFPEMAVQGYLTLGASRGDEAAIAQQEYYYATAETIPGETTELIAERAAEFGMYIQVGIAERSLHGNVLLNSVALIGPDGLVGVYRKAHNQFEFPYFLPGNEIGTWTLPFGETASSICYDLAMPEVARVQALMGAESILNSTAWPGGGLQSDPNYNSWALDMAAQSTAFFNQIWVVVSNFCGPTDSDQSDFCGRSQIVDPFGHVVARIDSGEGLAVHTADLSAVVRNSRTRGFCGVNFLQDRRPELYGPIGDCAPYSGDDGHAGLDRVGMGL